MIQEYKIYLKIYSIGLLLVLAIIGFFKSGNKKFDISLINALKASSLIPTLLLLMNI